MPVTAMFRYLLAALTGFLVLAGGVGADPVVEDPGAAESADEGPGWEVERYYLPEGRVREGETVISMLVDLDGDGLMEKLVTTNRQRNGKMGNMWEAYDVSGNRFRALGGDIQFHEGICGVLVEEEFDTAPRLYALDYEGDTWDLVAFSVAGGKVITEKVKLDVDFEEYSALLKDALPQVRTRDAAEIRNLYPKENVLQFVMAPDERRNPKEETAGRRRTDGARQYAADDSKVAGGTVSKSGWYVLAAGGLVLLACVALLRKKSA